jgi:hypothetical protein
MGCMESGTFGSSEAEADSNIGKISEGETEALLKEAADVQDDV